MLSMAFVFLVLLATVLFCVYDCRKPRGFPPGPTWLPVIGCLPKLQRLRQKLGFLHLAFEKLTETYGPILGVKLGQQKFVVVSSHELVKKVLLRDEFNGRPDGFFFRVRSFGERKGVIFTEGSTWSYNRRLVVKHLRAFGFGQPSMQGVPAREARALVQNLRDKGQDRTPIPMHEAFDVPVINNMWTIIAGNRFPYDDPKFKKILQVTHDAFRTNDTLGGLVSQVPFLRFIVPEFCGYNHLMSVLEKLWKFIDDEIDKHESEMRLESHEARDLMDAFILEMMSAEEDPTARPLDRKDIIMLCLDLFMAGVKTTTDALAITFAFLGHHPEWVKALQEDLDDVVGRDRDPILEDVALMPRVEAFFNEVIEKLTINLNPSGKNSPANIRGASKLIGYFPQASLPRNEYVKLCRKIPSESTSLQNSTQSLLGTEAVQRTQILTPLGVPHCTKTNVSFEGYEIPKDTVVLVNYHDAHNDRAIWDRPDEFLPQRFLDDDGKFNKNHDFIPFGLGKRRCLGETLARSSLFLYFTYILHHFDIALSEEHGLPCLEGTDGFVISPKPYHLILTPRLTKE